MTPRGFLAEAKAVGGWRRLDSRVTGVSIIRAGNCCPLWAVFGPCYLAVGAESGLSFGFMREVMYAADGCASSKRGKELRAEMESWCK